MSYKDEPEAAFDGYHPLTIEESPVAASRLRRVIWTVASAFIILLCFVGILFSLIVSVVYTAQDASTSSFDEYEMGTVPWMNFTCNNETNLEVFGNKIKLSEIIRGNFTTCTRNRITKLLIFATETIFIDTHIQRHVDFPNLEYLSLVAPHWSVEYEGVVEFDLSGSNGLNASTTFTGKAGNPGGAGEPGGGFVGIYLDASVKYKSSSILINVKGGNGGNGGDGLNGQDGEKGRHATFYDLPPVKDAYELAIPVKEIAPGGFVRALVYSNGSISKNALAINLPPICTEPWFTVVGFSGEIGKAGGAAGVGGEAGFSGKAVLLRLSSGSISSKKNPNEFPVNIVNGDGKPGIDGMAGQCGTNGEIGYSISCYSLSKGSHTIWIPSGCRHTKFTLRKHNISCDIVSDIVEKIPLPKLEFVEVPRIINKFERKFTLPVQNIFLQLLYNSSTLVPFLSVESLTHELFTSYRENVSFSKFLTRLKLYVDFVSTKNDIRMELGNNELITLDFLRTFALLAQENFCTDWNCSNPVPFPLNYLRENLLQLEDTIIMYQNYHPNENDSNCSVILKSLTQPTYKSAFLKKSFGLLEATHALHNLVLRASTEGMRMIHNLFPAFVNKSGYAASIQKYLQEPLKNVREENCTLFINFHRLVKKLERNLDELRFQNLLIKLASLVNEDNVLRIIQDYKLVNISEHMKDSMKHENGTDFKFGLVSTIKNAVPWFNISCEQDGDILLVYGNAIKLSWFVDGDKDKNKVENLDVTWPKPCEQKHVKKFLLMASKILYIDKSLNRQGPTKSLASISFIAPKFIIQNENVTYPNVTLDLSGVDAADTNPKPESFCLIPGSSGKNGESGSNGGSGGGVALTFSNMKNAEQLAINVNGGTGGNGQDGGDGCDGLPGSNAGLINFPAPLTNDYLTNQPFEWRLEQKKLEPDGALYDDKISGSGILEESTAWYTVTGFSGARGGDGGNGGDGGAGGLRGVVEIFQLPKNDNAEVHATVLSNHGIPGTAGVSGNAGKEGLRGDNYSCRYSLRETWTDCYSSCNCRRHLYRRFKDGKPGKSWSVSTPPLSSTQTPQICEDVTKYFEKLEKYTESAFLISLVELQKTKCSSSSVAKPNASVIFIYVVIIIFVVRL